MGSAATPLTPSLLARLENAVRADTRGELEAARQRYRDVLDDDPDNFEALSLLGKLECRLGDHGASVFHLQRASRLAPDRADVHLGLGYALANVGEQKRAVRAFLDALEADPTYAPAFVSLGCVFAQHEQHELARRAFEFARQAGSEYPEVHYQLGKYYHSTGHTEPALAALLNAVRLGGRFEDVHLLLARLYAQQGAYEDALEQLEYHADVMPQDPDAFVIKSAALVELGQYDRALKACQLALQFEPRNVPALVMLGRIHFLRSDLNGARRSYQAAINMNDSPAAHAGLSEVCAREGEVNKALRHIRQAGDPKDYDVGTALLCTDLLQMRDQTGEAIRLLSYRLNNRLDHAAGRRRCHFRLGELHEYEQDYARAFKHYTLANELRASRELVESDDAARSFFDRDRMARLRRSDGATASPVFLVGMPGFALSLFSELLGCHPEVAVSAQRLPLEELAHSLPSVLATPDAYPEALSQARRAELGKLARRFLESNFSVERSVLIDAQVNNASYLGFASLLFPGMRVVQIVQQPADLALDLYTHESPVTGDVPSTMPLISQRINQFTSTLDHWHTLGEFPMLSLNYEQFVARPRATLDRVLGFINIDYDSTLFSRLRSPGPSGDLLSIARGKVGRSDRFRPFMDEFVDNPSGGEDRRVS